MNCNLPPFPVYVRGMFISLESSPARGHLVCVRALANQALQFSVLLEDGSLYTGLPINALMTDLTANLMPLSDCQPWDAISSEIQVICLEILRYMPVIVTPLNKTGKYLFSIDFVGNNDLSRNAEHWKMSHVINLDDGNLVIYPQYNLKFLDKALCWDDTRRNYKHNEITWLAE